MQKGSFFFLTATLLSADISLGEVLPDGVYWNWSRIQAGRVPAPPGVYPIKIAFLDTGIASGPDGPKRSSISPDGFDFVSADADPADDNGHGTHIAGLIVGSEDGAIRPLCPECLVVPIKVLDERGEGTPADVARGIRYAVARGARVINLSLGYPPGSEGAELVARAVAEAQRRGVLVVASVGNEARFGITEPAALPGVIAVASVTSRGARAPYSNLSPRIDIAAPGGDDGDDNHDGIPDAIVSLGLSRISKPEGTSMVKEYWLFSGTSQAAAQVSALAGRLMAWGASADEARRIVIATACDDVVPGFDAGTGYGIINARSALEFFLSGATLPYSRDYQFTLRKIAYGDHVAWEVEVSSPIPPYQPPLNLLEGVTIYVRWEEGRKFRSAVTDATGIALFVSPKPGDTTSPTVLRAVRGGLPFEESDFNLPVADGADSAGLLAAPLRNFLPRAQIAGGK